MANEYEVYERSSRYANRIILKQIAALKTAVGKSKNKVNVLEVQYLLNEMMIDFNNLKSAYRHAFNTIQAESNA